MKRFSIILFAAVLCHQAVSQNVGIGTTAPQSTAKLHVDLGTSNSKGLLITGVYSSQVTSTVPNLGAGSRLMFYPGKGAFRAGFVTGTEWDDINTGLFSFAGCISTVASGDGSAAFGTRSRASGRHSFAAGQDTEASGVSATALGHFTQSSGLGALTSGYGTGAHSYYSTALGVGGIARGYASTVIGVYNDSLVTGAGQTTIQPTTPLFIIGNGDGISAGQRSNAMAVYKNGNMVLKNPVQVTVNPVSFTVPVSGAGTRLMWLPEKGAFRVGTVVGLAPDVWDAANIGLNSFASGINTLAFGPASTAMGENVSAAGRNSTAMGSGTIASGRASTSMGLSTSAISYSSITMGHYNADIAGSNPLVWVASDPLLILGNGIGSGLFPRSNALVVLKNGNTGIGVNDPGTNKLQVNGNTKTNSLQVGSGTKFTNMQSGSYLIGNSATAHKVAGPINFPASFATVPKIVCTVVNDDPNQTNANDTWVVSVRNISASGFTVNVVRVDFNGGWAALAKLNWIAFTD